MRMYIDIYYAMLLQVIIIKETFTLHFTKTKVNKKPLD